MDQMDPLSGFASFYMKRGFSGFASRTQQSEIHGSSDSPQLASLNIPFQLYPGGGSIESSAIPPPGVNVGEPSAAPPDEPRPVPRKRGRPRNYETDGRVSPASTQKRGRGRPPTTRRKQQLVTHGGWLSGSTDVGSTDVGFTTHIITTEIGENIASKVMLFSQQGPKSVCILSANGCVSTVILGTITYEGTFEILCMSGSYVLTDDGSSTTGGLSVCLAGSDGRVIGGAVCGRLIAASRVQVIVGSFVCNGAGEGLRSPRDSRSSDS